LLASADMWFAFSLSLVIVTYNNVVNRWTPFHGAAYVPLNLTFTGALALAAAATLAPSRAEVGLEGDIVDAGVAFAAVAVYALGAFASPTSASPVYAGQSSRTTCWCAFRLALRSPRR
jgi:hypothetical protein